MGIAEKKNKLVEDLSYLPDRFERFSYIVDYGKNMPELDDSMRSSVFKVEGCQSQLWLVPQFENGVCKFKADSDSAIVKGIAGIICYLYSDETPEDVLKGDVNFLQDVGIDQHLSSNRRNGLGKVDERIKRFAENCLKEKQS